MLVQVPVDIQQVLGILNALEVGWQTLQELKNRGLAERFPAFGGETGLEISL
jgi:hypothetical protein